MRSNVSEPTQHFYQSQRLRLAFWSWGEESSPPLVLVHGRRTHARAWDPIAESLCDRYYVVAPDLRGHGDSAWCVGSHYAFTEFMLDLVRLIGLLGGRATVVAHSFGASVSLFTAGVFPELVDRFVSIEALEPRIRADQKPGPGLLREWALGAQSQETRPERTFASLADAASQLRTANPRLSVPFAEHLARWGTRAVPGGLTWKFDPWLVTQNGLELRGVEIEPYWLNISCPVLHIIGAESTVNRATFQGRPIEGYFRDARAVTVEGAGHWVQHERLEAVLSLVQEFLNGDGATSAGAGLPPMPG